MTHIIYVPGLGDKYDVVRKIGLRLWRRKNVKVSHFPMKWENTTETYEEKMNRLEMMIDSYPGTDIVLVGESAGGSIVIAAARRFRHKINRVITVCGMNHGADSVNPALYRKNIAFHDAMIESDSIVPALSDQERSHLYTIYSSMDSTVRPKHTLIDGVSSLDLRPLGHMQAILSVLYFRYSLVLK